MNRQEESEWIASFHPAQRAHVVRWLREKGEREKMVEDIASAVVRKLTEEQEKELDEAAKKFARTKGGK